ncbi:MAG: tryptophan synthase subunit alpha [Clostridia bacterium]|nr:tryptophan synthase subunit alpha [Clostridia bacterium]
MSKLKEAFLNGKTLAPFITCGDPNLQATAASIREAVKSGAKLIVLGIPFSDPTAEAPLLQEASIRALKGGVNTDKVFAFMKELRETVSVPVVFVTYANVVFSYGVDRFMENCDKSGVNGLMIPDLPYEERGDFLPECKKCGIELVTQLALNSDNRIEMIAKDAGEMICLTAKIAAGSTFDEALTKLKETIERIRKASGAPCLIDFDLDDADQVRKVVGLADGILISSAIVRLQAKYGDEASKYIGECVEALSKA